jgi:hypothetical protein
MSYARTVGELKKELEGLPDDMMVRAGSYDTWRGEWKLTLIGTDTLFTDEAGERDLSDKERDRDIETLIIF